MRTERPPGDGESRDDERGRRRSEWTSTPLSAGREPWWLNQATVKGSLLITAGVVVLATPGNREEMRVLIGVVLVVWALVDLGRLMVQHRGAGHHVSGLRVAVLLGVGISFVVFTRSQLTALIGVLLVALAVVQIGRLVRGRTHRSVWATTVSAALMGTAGAVMFLVPETAVLALRAGLGGVALVVGGILVRLGLDRTASGEEARIDLTAASTLINEWLRDQKLPPETSDDIAETLFFEPPRRGAKLGAFWTMMGLATAIATFAVIQDSTAVVIGAMLVAPLMTPIMGVSAAAVNGWPARIVSSMLLIAAAVAAAIGLAWLIAAWLPSVGNLLTNSQVTSRVEPSLLDLCIALAAGAAGAFATVNPRVSSSLSGVAIAVALVPPLAVVGLTLQQGLYDQSLGAFLLFCTNFVCIVLASSLVFLLTGFAAAPPSEQQRQRLNRILGSFLAVAVLIAIPLSLTSTDLWNESSDQAAADEAVTAWLAGTDDLQLVSTEVENDVVQVVITGSSDPPDVDRLEQQIATAVDHPVELKVRVVPSRLLQSGG